jgi:AAA domain
MRKHGAQQRKKTRGPKGGGGPKRGGKGGSIVPRPFRLSERDGAQLCVLRAWNELLASRELETAGEDGKTKAEEEDASQGSSLDDIGIVTGLRDVLFPGGKAPAEGGDDAFAVTAGCLGGGLRDFGRGGLTLENFNKSTTDILKLVRPVVSPSARHRSGEQAMLLLIGVPASGKSFFAEKLVAASSYVRINQDDMGSRQARNLVKFPHISSYANFEPLI